MKHVIFAGLFAALSIVSTSAMACKQGEAQSSLQQMLADKYNLEVRHLDEVAVADQGQDQDGNFLFGYGRNLYSVSSYGCQIKRVR